MILIKVLLFVSLLYIAYEDFLYRTLSLYAILIFCGLAITYSFSILSYKTALHFMFINLVVITFQLILTWFYFRLFRGKKFIDKKLGMGDVLFYVPALFLFSPLNFICLHILSLLLILGGSALYQAIDGQVKTIPLAGGLSVVFSLMLLISWFSPTGNLYDDLIIADILYLIP